MSHSLPWRTIAACYRHLSSLLIVVSLITCYGCGSKSQTIVDAVPDAENLFFTEDGRLFVSGGSNVYEIIQTDDGHFLKLDTYHGNCTIEGITQREDYLYAVCSSTRELGKSYLLAAAISAFAPTQADIVSPGIHPFMTLETIYSLATMGTPNGLVTDEFGALFVSDSTKNDIVKITLSGPTEVDTLSIWASNIMPFVNGLEWVGDALYFTGMDFKSLNGIFGVVQRNPDGSAGDSQILYRRFATVLDDIARYRDGFLITDYLKGTLLFWRDGAIVTETPAKSFFSPSAVVPAQPPMFNPNALLVTEKGIIFNNNPKLGNKVGLYLPTL